MLVDRKLVLLAIARFALLTACFYFDTFITRVVLIFLYVYLTDWSITQSAKDVTDAELRKDVL